MSRPTSILSAAAAWIAPIAWGFLAIATLPGSTFAQEVSPAQIVTGAATETTQVKSFEASTLDELKNFLAYPGFAGGVRVAVGDLNGDGTDDIVTGTGVGAAHVKVFNGSSGSEIRSFSPYSSFTGGVFVASGDVNNDGRDDIVTGTDDGAAHVKVFNGQSLTEIFSFLPYGPNFTGGVTVAAGDINGDGFADIITGTGTSAAGPHVKVFDGSSGSELLSFLPYSTSFTGGVFVASGDINGDGLADIITGTGDGAAHVKVFDGSSGLEIRSFLPYSTFTGGVTVAAGDLNGDGYADIVTGTATGLAHVKVFDGRTGGELSSFFPYGSFTGGVFVAATAIPEASSPLLLAAAGMILAWIFRYTRNHAAR